MPPAGHDRPQKRQRVTQACQRCRGRKFRCDGGSPSCGACLSARATCSYDTTSGRQRGLKSGYVKVLESLWGSVFQNIPGSEHVVSHLLAILPANAENAADDPSAGNDNASPLERWRASSIPAAIRALLDGKPLPALDSPGVATTTWNLPSTSGVDNVEQHNRPETLPLTSSLDDVERQDLDAALLPSLPMRAPNLSLPVATGLPELPQDWQPLVQVYLCTEYCCLPIFEKACPYRWAYKYQDHANVGLCDLRSSHRGQYASLWAILVLGELHLYGAKSTRLGQMKQSAKMLLATAESSGPNHAFAYAFLLWSLVYTGSCTFTLARMMLAQAMVLADVRDECVDVRVEGDEALVQAGCFVVDTVLTFATGARTSTMTVDADALPSGDVGEWDPFISALGQGNPTAAPKTSSQLPPSRTGSTFSALLKLMTILSKMSDAYSNPEVLASDLRAWEASLAVELRRAVTAEATATRIPVPSQLNLRSWYATFCSMLARLRQDATGSASNGVSADLALQNAGGALHITSQEYGFGMLPATSSILLLQASQLPADLNSLQHTLSEPQDCIATLFKDHWGWPNRNRGGQQDLARPAAKRPQTNMHQPVIPQSLTEDLISVTTGLERQGRTISQPYITGDAAAEPTIQPGSQPLIDVDRTQPLSQWRLSNEASAPSVDVTIPTNIESCMADPASYDLLEYLTMFENNNWYVGGTSLARSITIKCPSAYHKHSDDREYMEPLGYVSSLHYPA